MKRQTRMIIIKALSESTCMLQILDPEIESVEGVRLEILRQMVFYKTAFKEEHLAMFRDLLKKSKCL